MPGSKTWVVNSDNSRHPELDGETVPLFEAFSNGGQYPGDPALDVSETAGCTCTMDIEMDAESITPDQASELGRQLFNMDRYEFADNYARLTDADRAVMDQLVRDFSTWDLADWQTRLGEVYRGSAEGQRLREAIRGYAYQSKGDVPELARGVHGLTFKTGEVISLPVSDWTGDLELARSYAEGADSRVLHLQAGSLSMPADLIDPDPAPMDRWLNWGGQMRVTKVEGQDVWLRPV